MQPAAGTMHTYYASWSGRIQRGRAIIHLALLLLLLLLLGCCRAAAIFLLVVSYSYSYMNRQVVF